MKSTGDKSGQGSGGDMLSKLTGLMDKLKELAETGGQFSRTGEIHGMDPSQGLKGIFGVNFKVGLGDQGIKVEPFGNVRKSQSTGQAEVHEIREPMVDLFDEEDMLLVVVELPGVGPKDLKLELEEDILTISSTRADKRYYKELMLPGTFDRQAMSFTCNNGVVEITFEKKGKSDEL